MNFIVGKTSDWEYKQEIELNTIDELMVFIKTQEFQRIVIEKSLIDIFNDTDVWTIEIYDNWRE